MAYTDLRFKPGINKEITPYSEENGWVDCDKVRFRFGYPEKLNGWAKNSTNAFLGQCRGLHEWVALSGEAFLGLGTQLKYYIKQGSAYRDITPVRLPENNSCTFSITSNTDLITVTDVNHGCVVNDFVTFSSASAATGNITEDVLNQEYQISEIIDGNTYKFQPRSKSTIESITITGGLSAANNLTPNASGTPTGQATYQIGTGLNSSVAGTGWGAGLWGGVNNNALQTTITNDIANSGTSTTFPIAERTGTSDNDFILINSEIMKITATGSGAGNVTADRAQKGTTIAAHTNGDVLRLISGNADGSNDFNGWGLGISTGTQTTTSNLRIWSHDNFGEDLIINERNGGIYYWDKDEQSTTITPFLRAKELSTLSGTKRSVPQKAAQVLLSDRDRHVIAFGADGLGGSTDAQGNNVQDPMLIRFSSQENPLDWFPTDTNTAGDLRIDAGSKIVQAVETRQQILVITDVAIYAMQFIGPPFTFGINLISSNITIASPRAAVAVNDSVYWMGDAEFYSYAGAVQRIPCTVRDHVFNDFNTGEAEKVVAGSNISFAEIWWFYPSSGSSENNKYVIYNYQENIWYIGSLGRTAWLDRGISALPVATGTDNYLFDHETGSQDDGSVMTSFIESGDMGISDGNQFSFISRVIPDLNFRESTDDGTTQVNFIFTAKNAPGQVAQNTETNTVEKTVSNSVGIYTNQYQTRLRGRSFTFKIESTGEASRKVLWRLGIPRIDIRSDGRR